MLAALRPEAQTGCPTGPHPGRRRGVCLCHIHPRRQAHGVAGFDGQASPGCRRRGHGTHPSAGHFGGKTRGTGARGGGPACKRRHHDSAGRPVGHRGGNRHCARLRHGACGAAGCFLSLQLAASRRSVDRFGSGPAAGAGAERPAAAGLLRRRLQARNPDGCGSRRAAAGHCGRLRQSRRDCAGGGEATLPLPRHSDTHTRLKHGGLRATFRGHGGTER
mmetsp:Transcript_103220/g.328313  ORF Transcript_103220/g.328313 Transcript_103220/m.328313 type:complete len:219 (+) Transcript_103220:495-1151(+)